MAVRHYRAQVIIPHDNGLPADSIVNTWHYLGDDAVSDAVNAADFEAQLDAFYTSFVPNFASSVMDWSNIVTKHTVFEDNPPRIPFMESTISPGTPNGAAYDWPNEVAIVLSMEAQRLSGVNMRRRRGRVYLGPLAFAATDLSILPSGSADFIANAADTAFFGSNLTSLAVYSPYTHHAVPIGGDIKDYPDEVPSQLLLSFHEVVKVWCDNAFDTQRRRGAKATYRKSATK